MALVVFTIAAQRSLVQRENMPEVKMFRLHDSCVMFQGCFSGLFLGKYCYVGFVVQKQSSVVILMDGLFRS